MALRLRKDGSKWLQTLKTAGVATGGLHKRGEWEHSLRIPQLDLSLFRETPLAALAQSKALHLTLKPAFTTEFHRTTWCLEMSPGERVEVALALLGEIALAPEILSKAERGYRLFRPASPAPPAPLQAEAIELKRNWPPHQAMSAIIAGLSATSAQTWKVQSPATTPSTFTSCAWHCGVCVLRYAFSGRRTPNQSSRN